MKPPKKKLSLFLLILLVVSAIDSVRNLPAAALFGSSLIFFFLFAALIFLIPTSLIAAELASTFPDKGGVYHWMTEAFGDKIGMLSIWLQWINTLVWYPTILSFIAGTSAYLIHPGLADNKYYILLVILIIFWGLTLLNLFGVEISASINSYCGLIGAIIPMSLLMILGVIWLIQENPLQIVISPSSIFPSLIHSESWLSLTAIIASFLGIELAGVHINDIKNPQKNFPLAMAYSSIFLILTMLFGALAIAFVLPIEKINLVSGIMQVFDNFFKAFSIPWATPIITLCILVGSIGGIINWLIAPVKGLLHSAEYGFLPKVFLKKNTFGVAHHMLIIQGVCVTIFCFAFFLVPSVNAFYWFLTALSTDLYIIMYIIMFLSALKLRYKMNKRSQSFSIPGGLFGIWITCLLGLFGCSVTLIISFFPPTNLDFNPVYYAALIATGNLLMIAPVGLFYLYRGKRKPPSIPPAGLEESLTEPITRPPLAL